MAATHIDDAIASLEKANADLEPEFLTSSDARKFLAAYARAEKLAAFGVAALARKIDNPSEIASTTGTSMGQAKETISTGKVLKRAGHLSDALRNGAISLVQATEIAKAEESWPGAATILLPVAKKEPFHVLKDKARKTRLEAEQHKDLAERQHRARHGRSYTDDLGMVHVHLALEPHVGAPITARAEAHADRLARAAKKKDPNNYLPEPFERYVADAYAALLTRSDTGRPARPELVVLVSHEVTQRGWKNVRKGEVCKIPGLGPISPQVAKDIAQDAFLSGVFYDGKDLRHFTRWTRHIPVEVAIALQLGSPPNFDGIACVDCGKRFKNQIDHVQPRFRNGPTSNPNLRPRCWNCHQKKSKREQGQHTGPEP
jgi:5-methylcytosine-specific restriction endonuclease McrA